MRIDYSSIGARIKKLRKEKKITQEQLAESLSVTVGYVSQIERGITKANLETLAPIAEILGCELSGLLDGTLPSQKRYYFDEMTEILNTMTPAQRKLLYRIAEEIVKAD